MGQGVKINVARLRQLVDGYQQSRKEFCEAARVSERNLARLLKGEVNPNPLTLERIAKTLRVDVESLRQDEEGMEFAQRLLDALGHELGCSGDLMEVSRRFNAPDDWAEMAELKRKRLLTDAVNALIRAIESSLDLPAEEWPALPVRRKAHDLSQTLMAELLEKVLPKQLRSEEVLASLLLRCPELKKPMIAAVLQQAQGGVVEYKISGTTGQDSDMRIELNGIFPLELAPQGCDFSVDRLLWKLHIEVYPDAHPTPETMSGVYPPDLLEDLLDHLQNVLRGERTPDSGLRVMGVYMRVPLVGEQALTEAVHAILTDIPLVSMSAVATTDGYLLTPTFINSKFMAFLTSAEKLLADKTVSEQVSGPNSVTPSVYVEGGHTQIQMNQGDGNQSRTDRRS